LKIRNATAPPKRSMFAKVALLYLLGPEIPSSHRSGNSAKGSKSRVEKRAKARPPQIARVTLSTINCVSDCHTGWLHNNSGCSLSAVRPAAVLRPKRRKTDKSTERGDIDEHFNPLHRRN
jgi:hypothetical protein